MAFTHEQILNGLDTIAQCSPVISRYSKAILEAAMKELKEAWSKEDEEDCEEISIGDPVWLVAPMEDGVAVFKGAIDDFVDGENGDEVDLILVDFPDAPYLRSDFAVEDLGETLFLDEDEAINVARYLSCNFDEHSNCACCDEDEDDEDKDIDLLQFGRKH